MGTYQITIRLPPKPNEIFASSAADGMIGKMTKYNGLPAKITNAWVQDGDLYLSLEISSV